MISYLFLPSTFYFSDLCYDLLLLDLDLGVEFLEGNDLSDVGEVILECWMLALIRVAVGSSVPL
jgi:hypothetical protein